MGLARLIGAIGGSLEAIPEGLILVLVGAHQGAPFIVKCLDGGSQLRRIHAAPSQGFHGFAQRHLFGLGCKAMPVLQFGAAGFEFFQLAGQGRIALFVDDGLGLVPEAIGVAQIALSQLRFSATSSP